MRFLAAFVATLLAACNATSTATVPPASSPAAEASQTATAGPAVGVERLCEAFEVVNDEISPAYEGFEDDPVSASMTGLAIVTAGADIKDLADDVEPVELATAIREMGQRFEDEGARVAEGDLSGGEAIGYYLELLEQYGSEC